MSKFSSPIYSGSLCLVLFTLGCSSIKNFGSSTSKGSVASSENSKPSNPSQTENSGSGQPSDADLPPEALPPAIVAGGYLTCQPSEEAGTLECFVPNEDGTAASLPQYLLVTFRFVPKDGSPAIPLDFQRGESVNGGTVFLIKVNELSEGELKGSFPIDGKEANWIFDMNTVSQEISGDFKAFDLLNLPFSSNNRFGDGEIGSEGDGCFGADVTPTIQPVGGLQFRVDQALKDVFIMLTEICGLQTSETTVKLVGPPPLQEQTVKLAPNLANVVLFRVNLLPGSYQILIDNSNRSMLDGTQDDFFIKGIRFSSSVQQANAISDLAFHP